MRAGQVRFAIIIVPKGADDGEDRLIGPFANGNLANTWAWRHLPRNIQWHWLPLEPPINTSQDKTR